MKTIISIIFLLLTLIGCKSVTPAPQTALEPLLQWLPKQEQKSWAHMQENISPKEPKHPGEAPPVPGIVVGALHKKDPDYYFHWVRDSSHVMQLVAEAFALKRPYATTDLFEREFRDYLALSAKLQKTNSKFGLGEPRFTVHGEVDPLPWSRPQYDGPALRALAVLKFLETAERRGLKIPRLDAQARQVLATDLNYITQVWNERGFDLWEEYKAENYHTRLVQLAALEKGANWFEKHPPVTKAAVARYRDVAHKLEAVLDDHWDPARGFLRSQLVIVATDGYTAKKTDLDSAIIVGVMDADRDKPGHSVLDDRVQATVAVLEDLFRKTYPINQREDVGLGYGRYFGDVYYGGNPWYLITAYYAEFYYRLADKLQSGNSLPVTARNLTFLRSSLSHSVSSQLQPGSSISPGSDLHRQAIADFTRKGDRILQRFELHTPADGQLYEQFDKSTGKPTSSRGIGWSHSAFLSALYERQRLMRTHGE